MVRMIVQHQEYRGRMAPDTHDVPASDTLDRAALTSYLRWHLEGQHIPGLQLDAAMHVVSCAGGRSRLTDVVRLGGAEFVLRRPRLGGVAPDTNAVAREYRWLSVVHPHFELAPRPLLLCEDTAVIGSPFFLMERRRGMAVRASEPVTLAHPDLRRQLSEAVVDTLATLHELDVEMVPEGLRSPAGFAGAQVHEWTERWRRAHDQPVVDMDAVALWLSAHAPVDSLEPNVVHGHFALENLLLNPLHPAEVTAVLDWETAVLGDPLWDLGVLLAHWVPVRTDDGDAVVGTVTSGEGYLTRDALVHRYADRTGRDLDELTFFEVFALFQSAVVRQEWVAAESQPPDERGHRPEVHALARRARTLIA